MLKIKNRTWKHELPYMFVQIHRNDPVPEICSESKVSGLKIAVILKCWEQSNDILSMFSYRNMTIKKLHWPMIHNFHNLIFKQSLP